MTFVTAALTGGLANRIFIIHAAITYAKKTKRKFVLVQKLIINNAHESNQITLSSLEALFGKFTYYTNDDYQSWKYVRDPKQNAFAFENPPMYPGESVIFEGYFQSPKYFLPSPSVPLEVTKKPNTYFIHIRLGDYCNTPIYQIPLKAYYSEAIMQITENDIHAKFLVFSNENTKAQTYITENIKVPFDYTFSQAESAFDTLKEMASCAGGICANSSLSWMGAYYQAEPRSNIYMPDQWIVPNPIPLDIYPDWATVIKSE